jgi:hypothetical protein
MLIIDIPRFTLTTVLIAAAQPVHGDAALHRPIQAGDLSL